MLSKSQSKLLFFSSLGGVLEFYDFIIYALLANCISAEFFPTNNPITSLIATFATFAAGYLVRPIGGVIFGHFGDKFGRKKTFTVSIFMMAFATFCIGLIPSYATLGIAAPILLTLCRVLQGLSVGGEIPGALAYVSESMPEKKGVACGTILCALLMGIVLGSLIQAILNSSLTEPQMMAWGWRVPFFIGGAFGLLSYKLRQNLEESTIFQSIENQTVAFPLAEVFKQRFVNTLAATLIVALGASTIVLLFLFISTYLTTVLHTSSGSYVWFKTLAIFLSALLCIVFGLIADRVNNKKLMFFISLLIIAVVYPIFIIYVNYFASFLIALFITMFLVGSLFGIIPGMLGELFPTNIRYSGIAVSYNLGFAIFGGLTPLIAMFLIYQTGSPLSPALYLIGTAVLCIVALFLTKHTALAAVVAE